MRSMALARRNLKEICLDPLGILLAVGLPAVLLVVFNPIARVESFFSPTNLAPGIALFGFAMLSLSSGMILARDRDSAFLSRLLTAPLRASDFITAYSIPYLPVAIIQIAVVFGIGALLGLQMAGNAGLVFLVLMVMSVGYLGLGMILGLLFSYKTVSIAWIVVNLLTVFGGAWFSLEVMGTGFQNVMNLLPFAHAIDAARNIMLNGEGFTTIATDFYWVLGYTVVFFGLGVFLFRRRMTA